VVEALVNNQVDIAYLGGFTYIQAASRAEVQPLVQRVSDQSFHSLFITQADAPIRSLADLKNKRFAFGDINSTSGHLMPAFFMKQFGLDSQVFEKAIYTGGHDATALAVAHRKVDAGAMDEQVYEKMLQTGKISERDVRVFYKTPPFFDYIWVARKTLDPAIVASFSQAMISATPDSADGQAVLNILKATRFVPASDASYSQLRIAARDAGLLQ
jgi:phosphonate transport system substrate-binding protein